MQFLLVFLILIVVGSTLLLLSTIKKQQSNAGSQVFLQELMRKELAENRQELQQSLQANRLELNTHIQNLSRNMEEKLFSLHQQFQIQGKENREELKLGLIDFTKQFKESVQDLNHVQKEKLSELNQKQQDLISATELKLEKMRETVDEKLSKTLNERLGQSFKLVSERLEAVQKGLGEMQTLANGVGDLKKVLSNVKTRGVLGEIQLGNILEQILTTEQYEANVKTKQGSNDHVEYAVKLPGKDGNGKQIYLPIDAKFPQEDYVRLQAAYEEGNPVLIEQSIKGLVQSVKKFAKDIQGKYLDPPYTTDFGVMFLPIEGLYAEVVRQPDLVASLQREFKIIITGPTTLAAMLNSLQMGFKTLAIQKRSSEVWEVLGNVKSEFQKFGGVLEKAQKKMTEANQEIDKLVGTRTRMMLSKLRDVEEMNSLDNE